MFRPLILGAAVLANLAGLSMAHHVLRVVDAPTAILGMAVVLLATSMGHLFDEYSDVDTDSLVQRTPFSGGSGVLPSGAVPRSWALVAAAACGLASLATGVGGLFMDILNQDYVVMLVTAMALGYSYSMPPLRLERRGWGEIDNALLGTLMFLSGYLPQVGTLSVEAVIWSVPVFLAVMVNLIGVHWADREADAMVGRRTLVIRLGGRSVDLFLVLLATLFVYLSIMHESFPAAVLTAYALTLPVGLWTYWSFRRGGGPLPGSAFMTTVLVGNMVGWLL